MYLLAVGAAFVDRAGAVVAADPGFVSRLGLHPDDPTGTLRARAEEVPELRALLGGEGPRQVQIPTEDGETVQVERIPAGAGALLVLRAARADVWMEDAMRSNGLGRIASGVAHDIKNPLNAMSLQVALLGEKLAGSPEASASAAAHLGAVRDQIGRVNEVLRRFLDVAEPGAPLGYTDLGALVGDISALFAHEARRRRIALAVEAQSGVARTARDPARVARLALGLFSRALGATPDGGRLAVRAEPQGTSAAMVIEHTSGDPDPDVGYYTEVARAAARALGGEFSLERRGGLTWLSLSVPRIERA